MEKSEMEQSQSSSDQLEGGEQRQEENKEKDPVDALNEKLRTEAYALLTRHLHWVMVL
jgi:hypothetical protein